MTRRLTLPGIPDPEPKEKEKASRVSGRKLGRLLVGDSAAAYFHARKGVPHEALDRNLVFSHPCLQLEKNRDAFTKYYMLDEWLERFRSTCETYMQQCQVRYKTLTQTLQLMAIAEDVLRYVAKTRTAVPCDDPALEALLFFLETDEPSVLRSDLGSMVRRFRAPIVESYTVFKESYYFVDGYNYALDRIADIHKLPEVRVFRRGVNLLDAEISSVNQWIEAVKSRLTAPGAPDPEQQDFKLSTFVGLFPILDRNEIIAPRKEREKEADKLIRSFEGFGNPGQPKGARSGEARFLSLLFLRPAAKAEEG